MLCPSTRFTVAMMTKATLEYQYGLTIGGA